MLLLLLGPARKLKHLIGKGDVDITDTSYENIDDVRKEYFANLQSREFPPKLLGFCSLFQPRDQIQWCKATQSRKVAHFLFHFNVKVV